MKTIMSRWKPCWEWEPLTSDPLSVTWDFMVDYRKSCYLFTTLMEKHPLFCPLLFLSTTAASSPSESFAPAWVQILSLSSSGRLLSLWDSLQFLCLANYMVPYSLRSTRFGQLSYVSPAGFPTLAPKWPPSPQKCPCNFWALECVTR